MCCPDGYIQKHGISQKGAAISAETVNTNTIEQRSSLFRTTLLGFFITVTWFVPDTIDLVGKNSRFTNNLLSGLNTRSIFYPLFALLSLKYVVDCLLTSRLRIKSGSSILYFLTLSYVVVVGTVLQAAGGGYSQSRFMLPSIFFLVYTFGVYISATGSRGANYRTLSNIICGVGICLATILIIESFVIKENLYGYLFDFYFVDPSELVVDPRDFGVIRVLRSRGPFRNPLMAGFALLLPLSLVLSRIGIYSGIKNLMMLLTVVWIAAGILATVSYSAIIPALIIVATYALLYVWTVKGRMGGKVILVVILVITTLLIPFVTPVGFLFEDMVEIVGGNPVVHAMTSAEERFGYFVRGIHMWMGLPLYQQLLGKGFGYLNYDRLAFMKEFQINDFGLYMTMLLEIGLCGLIGFILFFFLWLKSSISRANRCVSVRDKTFYLANGAYVIGLFFVFWVFHYYNMFYIIAISYALYELRGRDDFGLWVGNRRLEEQGG